MKTSKDHESLLLHLKKVKKYKNTKTAQTVLIIKRKKMQYFKALV